MQLLPPRFASGSEVQPNAALDNPNRKTKAMENIYHATPYDINAAGFYFSDYEDYTVKAAAHRNEYGEPVEEYEIQFIDGENYQLFNALGVNQATLSRWFDENEEMEGEELVKAVYLLERGYGEEQINDNIDNIELYEGSPKDYAEEFIADTGMLDGLPENLRYYFDVEAFTRDMLNGGDISEVEIAGKNYVVRE